MKLLSNSRFYILTSSLLLSVGVVGLLRLQVESNQLYAIRLEQMFGFLSLGFLYTALITSPLSKAVGEKRSWIAHLLFMRRAIGVSAAYFALLHGAIAFWGQIGGVDGLLLLPNRFVWALTLGALALVILLLMAATSFDKVIAHMTVPRWKLLHRFIYGGGIFIILHVWMIGTHMTYTWLQIVLFTLLAVFFGLESLRVATNIARKLGLKWRWLIAGLVWAFWLGLLLAMPRMVDSHNKAHDAHEAWRIQEVPHA